MADDYGSGDDMNMEDGFGAEEGYSDDSQRSEDYSSEHAEPEEEDPNAENEESDEDDDNISNNSLQNYQVLQQQGVNDQPNELKITSPFMTKFEKAKIIGVRAVQISKNAPLYLNSENVANMNWDPITIAEKELAEKKIPFIIRRYLPDGSFEDWKLSDLKTFD